MDERRRFAFVLDAKFCCVAVNRAKWTGLAAPFVFAEWSSEVLRLP